MNKKCKKKLKETELEILDEIVRICEKHDIKYFLFYGTLIGCVRHKGMIPWDDDIDICMTRNDYNKFIKIAEIELNEKFIVDSIKTNKQYYLPFIKIRNKYTCFDEQNLNNKKYKGNKGIWVDILPLDYSKTNDSKLIKVKEWIAYRIFSLMVIKNINYKNKYLFLHYLLKIVPNRFLYFMYNSLIVSEKDKYDYLIPYASINNLKNGIYNKNDIFPLIKKEFEGKMYNVPNKYDKILTVIYGDYMKLPPIEERVDHNPRKIIFEDKEEFLFDK